VTWLKLFARNVYDWTFVHPETGLAVLVLSTALSASIHILIRSGKR
jgi:hypothetical protein